MKRIRRIFFIMFTFCLLISTIADCAPKACAASEMTASESCVQFIKEAEVFSPIPYYDYNQYTVGYGTKCPTEKFFDYSANGIPREEAETLLRDTITNIENTIHKKFIDKYNLTLAQHQFDALVSFSFNVGTGWMSYGSTLKNAILRNANDNDLVYAFGLYCTAGGKYLPGLITRRLCEANIFLNGIYSQAISNDYGYVYYDANGGTLTYRVQGFMCDGNPTPAADAVRNGDTFLGWYTNLNGGSQVSVLDSTLTGRTLFARWQSSENTEDQNTSTTAIKVIGDVVNIRSGPGTNYSKLKQVYRNEVLALSHITHLTNVKWGKVQDGWICLDYTNYDDLLNGIDHSDPDNNTESSDVVTDPGDGNDGDANTDNLPNHRDYVSGIVKVNDVLRIRSGPGTANAVVGFLFNGKEVDILEQVTVDSTVWGRISKGWVCMDYIITETHYGDETIDSDAEQEQETENETEPEPEAEPEAEPEPEPKSEQGSEQESMDSVGNTELTAVKGKITADALRIRSGAGTDNRIVGFYYQNDLVVVSEKIQVGSVYWGKTDEGWINMDYVSEISSSEETSQPSEGERKTVIGDCLRIRREAGTNYRISGLLYYGDSVTVFETKTVNGTVWGRVDKGWICMDYVD